jgi:hypothetical protein
VAANAFLIIRVNDDPGLGQKELGIRLHLAPSTVSRFIDMLAFKGHLTRCAIGKTARICSTQAGERLRKPIEGAWEGLHQRYAQVLGRKTGDALTAAIDKASQQLSDPKGFPIGQNPSCDTSRE